MCVSGGSETVCVRVLREREREIVCVCSGTNPEGQLQLSFWGSQKLPCFSTEQGDGDGVQKLTVFKIQILKPKVEI